MTVTIARLLIANRGEIAVRIAGTCRVLGIVPVAVFSDADAGALHVRSCEVAVRLPGTAPRDTYLRVESLLDAARRTGTDAVHPGYGFLAENADFAAAVIEAGLTWVGPRPEVIAQMGDKLAAKELMRGAGVPTLASIAVSAEVDVDAAADEVGFPILVKAAAGGGGKGMRVVRSAPELPEAVAAAQREAAGAFGDERVFLERYIEAPRHIEVQILGDEHGGLVHLFERECSIQRRHQKVIEESPAPTLSPAERSAVTTAAVDAGRALSYSNAGTVEFVYADGEFNFLEINTRLQVEHPVTEAVVRVGGAPVDLVALQLAVAAGERLPFEQADVEQVGHALEARLYAEDPANDYLPATGTLRSLARPAPASVPRPDEPGVRWDSGVETGDDISTHYDPMIAKVIARGLTRAQAVALLARELEGTLIDGVRTNRDLLVHVLRHEAFMAGETTTHFLDEHYPDQAARTFPPDPSAVETAAIVATLAELAARPWDVLSGIPAGFESHPLGADHARYLAGGHEVEIAYEGRRGGEWSVRVDGGDPRPAAVLGLEETAGAIVVELDGVRIVVRVSASGRERHVLLPTGQVSLLAEPRYPEHRPADIPGATLAPMPGAIVSVAVEEGDEVAEGDLLCVVEAMKMEHRITAPHAGTVEQVHVAAGDQVDADEVLIVVTPPD
ncbi:MAG: ATP-grasp domain-containing protein [Actinobacteria bacterium]|nr:ATP-grasp domain-containing protein [Actinomycetota bacterium]